MQAIRLTKKNLHKILDESPIQRRDLEAMIEEYDTPYINTSVYFVPKHEMAHDLASDSWMTLPWRLLEGSYKFDRDAINTKFTDISAK